MGAGWARGDFSEGGLKGVKEFSGRLVDVLEDVEGKYSLQKKFNFSDVEIIESQEPVVLKDGLYTAWLKQSSNKKSVDYHIVGAMIDFCEANNIEGELPGCLYDLNIVWKMEQFEFDGDGVDGEPMKPGSGPVPLSLVGKGSKRRTAKKPDETTTEEEAATPIPEEIAAIIKETIGEDGATRDMIRKATTSKAKNKKLVDAYPGGLDGILEALEEDHRFESESGFYSPVEATEATTEASF